MEFGIAVAWHNERQRNDFFGAWNVPSRLPEWLFMQQDANREGGAKTKNKAMRKAAAAGAEVVISLDDDCYPESKDTLESFAMKHIEALQPQSVEMIAEVTSPPSRGTPYFERTMPMPVAASMGFWTEIGDHCAARQLAFAACPMDFKRKTIYAKYFSLCGMNYAFKPKDWNPWFYMVEDVGRFDDIWMGWLWQKEAYRRGHCFNLNGPLVRHSRQSNVWANLINEARLLEQNETLWREIALHPGGDYGALRSLLPISEVL